MKGYCTVIRVRGFPFQYEGSGTRNSRNIFNIVRTCGFLFNNRISTYDRSRWSGVLYLGVRQYFRRRELRRQGTQLELGMAEAYGHEDHRAKFSQAEVDAKIKER